MRKLILISTILIIATACNPLGKISDALDAPEEKLTKKEIRKKNRAARHVEKAKRLDPDIVRIDSIIIPITVRTPSIEGRIVSRPSVPLINEKPVYIYLDGDSIPYFPKEPIYFEDDSLSARITYLTNGDAALDYTIKPMEVDTSTKFQFDKIAPTQYKAMPLSWWQKMRIHLGDLFLFSLLIALIILAIKRARS